MKRIRALLSLCFSIVLLGGTAGALYWLIQRIFNYVRGVPKEIGAALIAGVATVLVATFTVVIGRYFERKRELDSLYRDKKTEIYSLFLKTFFEVIHASSDGGSAPETDLIKFFQEFTPKLILWSGPEVIVSFVKWKDHLALGSPEANAVFLTEEFLLSVRKDLRHSNSGLRRGILAKIFLRDADVLLRAAAQNPNITLKEVEEIVRSNASTTGGK